MNQRRLVNAKARREKKMESPAIILRCRNHLWLVAFTLFVVWYLLLYVLDWSSLSPITQNHVSIQSGKFNPVDITKTTNEINGMSPSFNRVKDRRNKHGTAEETTNGEKPIKPLGEIVSKNQETGKSSEKPRLSCSGRYIYVHEIPKKFNDDLIDQCQSLDNWTNMCQYMMNKGLGQQLPRDKIFGNTGFYATHQFSLEVIFHNRMKQYDCLTNDSSAASAIFVPYYAGLDVARYLWGSNVSERDSGSLEIYKWLKEQPEWEFMWGRDHFLVAGRITWDFRRGVDEDSAWGNKLMLLPEAKNMTILTIESSPWNSNDFAIPYPTYFHPSNDREVFQWQNRMRKLKRRYLFSFAGAPRPNIGDSIRSEIMSQCQKSRRKCKLLECRNAGNKCLKPDYLMKLFQSSVFCLQPPGDSFTRRSTFDSIVAGCIPVFFHPASAYVQYLWHLPKNYEKYSVLIPEEGVKGNKLSIEAQLEKIPKAKVAAMKEEVVKLIPKVSYADPRSRLETLEDAFDLTVKGVLERVEKLRVQGRNSNFVGDEEYSWKQSFFGTLGNDEWDHYFKRRSKEKYWGK